jgi:hypothetical protein
MNIALGISTRYTPEPTVSARTSCANLAEGFISAGKCASLSCWSNNAGKIDYNKRVSAHRPDARHLPILERCNPGLRTPTSFFQGVVFGLSRLNEKPMLRGCFMLEGLRGMFSFDAAASPSNDFGGAWRIRITVIGPGTADFGQSRCTR